eukprot:601867-Prorocentrum_minimum.AAC.1
MVASCVLFVCSCAVFSFFSLTAIYSSNVLHTGGNSSFSTPLAVKHNFQRPRYCKRRPDIADFKGATKRQVGQLQRDALLRRCDPVFSCPSKIRRVVRYCKGLAIEQYIFYLNIGHQLHIGTINNKYVKRCSNSKGEVYLDPTDRGKRMTLLLSKFVCDLPMDTPLALDIMDVTISNHSWLDIPEIAGTRVKGNKKVTILPIHRLNYYFTAKTGDVGFNDPTYQMFVQNSSITDEDFDRQFVKRKDAVVWTGAIKNTALGFAYGRQAFVKLSKSEPASFKAFTDEILPFSEQKRYRYIMSLSGAGAWTFFTQYFFLLGSLVFLQDSPVELWWSLILKPWVHYIPVAEDLSDIHAKLAWVRANQENAMAIARRAYAESARIFNPGAILDFYKLQLRNLGSHNADFSADCPRELIRLITISFCKGPMRVKRVTPIKTNPPN